MSKLSDYILANTITGLRTEGADMHFFGVKAGQHATVLGLKDAIRSHVGEFCEVDLFDGKEHSYVEIGGWAGDQGLALRLMGLGSQLGMWRVLTPKNMLGPVLTLRWRTKWRVWA